ncbi:MAG: TlpA family protein disulfide reductase [Treponema sp.]|nr:TlpA family protein disulfide reductase [Treponema sp.]
MKKFLLFFPAVLYFFIFTQQVHTQVSPEAAQAFGSAGIRILEQRQAARNFTLPVLGGENTSLSSFRGKVVILNFWATWCPPCREEMPSMESLYRRFKDEGLEIVAVDMMEDTETVSRFISNNGYTFPVMLDRLNRTGAVYGVSSIPVSFILDREGRIIARVIGGISWNSPRMIAAFDALLKSR